MSVRIGEITVAQDAPLALHHRHPGGPVAVPYGGGNKLRWAQCQRA